MSNESMGLIQWFNNKIPPHHILRSSSSSEKYYFPEEILIQILCRIPADRVLVFRIVCRRWKSIISSPFFINLHNRYLKLTVGQPLNHHKNNHTILFSTHDECLKDRFGIYEGDLGFGLAGTVRTNMRIRSLHSDETLSTLQGTSDDAPCLRLLGSIDGLLVFDAVGFARITWQRYPKRIFILNPTTRETRVIRYPEGHVGYVCAIFFDRLQHRHTLLHVSNKTRLSSEVYHIFSLTQTAWRRIQITDNTPSASLASPNLVPPCLHSVRPAIVGDTIYWLVDDFEPYDERQVLYKTVMALNTQTYEIHYFRLPITPTRLSSALIFVSSCHHKCCSSIRESKLEKMELIEYNGKLCFCDILHSGEFELWSLEEECSWVKRFKFNLPQLGYNENWFVGHQQIWGPMILSFPHEDTIAIKWTKNGIYLYNLGTHKACRIKVGARSDLERIDRFRFTVLNKTLMSPNIA